MKPPRQLSSDEAAVWRKVAQTVRPLERKTRQQAEPPAPIIKQVPEPQPVAVAQTSSKLAITSARRANVIAQPIRPRTAEAKVGLDASWERKVARGGIEPDFSLDLHGSSLDQAYVRLMHGLAQARAMGARVVLIVTGKPRPTEAADRGQARGAIRAKIIDWLNASEHAGAVAAIRGAHRRHGGPGALYVVLKRPR